MRLRRLCVAAAALCVAAATAASGTHRSESPLDVMRFATLGQRGGGKVGNPHQLSPKLVPRCPVIHTAVCNGKGECNPNTGECMCYSGWTGSDCSLDPLSFYAFDLDCDEMTEEYITWCLSQTSFGSCTPYQLAWDQLCYRMCEAVQGVVCTTWTRRHYCAHTPDCPALCNNFLDTYCLPKDEHIEPVYGGGGEGGVSAPAEASGSGSSGSVAGGESEVPVLVKKAGINHRKGGVVKGGAGNKVGMGKLKGGGAGAEAAAAAPAASEAAKKAGPKYVKGGHGMKTGEMPQYGGKSGAEAAKPAAAAAAAPAATPAGEAGKYVKGGVNHRSSKNGWGGSHYDSPEEAAASQKAKKGEAPSVALNKKGRKSAADGQGSIKAGKALKSGAHGAGGPPVELPRGPDSPSKGDMVMGRMTGKVPKPAAPKGAKGKNGKPKMMGALKVLALDSPYEPGETDEGAGLNFRSKSVDLVAGARVAPEAGQGEGQQEADGFDVLRFARPGGRLADRLMGRRGDGEDGGDGGNSGDGGGDGSAVVEEGDNAGSSVGSGSGRREGGGGGPPMEAKLSEADQDALILKTMRTQVDERVDESRLSEQAARHNKALKDLNTQADMQRFSSRRGRAEIHTAGGAGGRVGARGRNGEGRMWSGGMMRNQLRQRNSQRHGLDGAPVFAGSLGSVAVGGINGGEAAAVAAALKKGGDGGGDFFSYKKSGQVHTNVNGVTAGGRGGLETPTKKGDITAAAAAAAAAVAVRTVASLLPRPTQGSPHLASDNAWRQWGQGPGSAYARRQGGNSNVHYAAGDPARTHPPHGATPRPSLPPHGKDGRQGRGKRVDDPFAHSGHDRPVVKVDRPKRDFDPVAAQARIRDVSVMAGERRGTGESGEGGVGGRKEGGGREEVSNGH